MSYVRAGLVGVLLASLSPGSGSAAPNEEGPLATDRPGNGNAPTTVGAFRLQIEASGNLAVDSGTELASFPTLLRFGVISRLELRVGSGLVGIQLGGADAGSFSATDTSVGVKVQLLESDGAVPALAVMVDTFLPTGTASFTTDSVVPDGRVSAGWSLPAGFALLANVGLGAPEDTGGRFAQLLYVLNLGYTLPAFDGRLSVFAESFGLVPLGKERDEIFQLDVGAAYLLTDNWQLDVFSQHGLVTAATDLQVSLGVSARL